MTSNINPNNIDGTYPVAGQDNNSQGFRDNFTNTKTNFQYAADEISDLQSNAILKSALAGSTLDNDMLGSLVYNGVVADFGLTRVALGTVSGSQTIDYSTGHFHTLTTGGSVSLSFSNFPASGVAGIVYVQVTIASTAHTLTVPAAVSVNSRGIQGLNTSTNVITFAATGTYLFQFITTDGGSSITIVDSNKEIAPFNNSSEALGNAGAANLALTTSYFSTTGAWTATLAAGTPGQIKTFAMYVDGGDMVITVTNAGWKSTGTGTITFNDIGDACTLQYINSKWFAIGANGVTFA
jgi:hypothetical protein